MTSGRALLAVVGVVALAGCGKDDGGGDETEAQGGPVSAEGFEAVLPAGWFEAEEEQLETITQAAVQETAATLDIPESATTIEGEALWFDSDSDGDLQTNVNVVSEAPGSLKDEAYVDASIESIGQVAGFANLEQTGTTKIDGAEAREIEYAGSTTDLRFRAAVLVHDGAGFNITLTAAANEFGAASEEFDEILASWKWTD